MPHERSWAPFWHPHRGFEDGVLPDRRRDRPKDSNGGGGLIADGDTQWMTAGGGILHDELPSERIFNSGGPTHAIQLWVNLPAAMKMMPPAYQPIEKTHLTLLTSPDGGALVRLIAGEVGPRRPGLDAHTHHAHPRHHRARGAADLP